MATETVNISRQALNDLIRAKDEFDSVLESIELMSSKSFMASYKKAKKQIKNRDFDDWNRI